MRNLFTLCFAIGSLIAFAQPINDDCEDATLLSYTGSCNFSTYSNLNATNSGAATASCGGAPTTDIWFKVVVPSSGDLVINTSRINFYAAMALYTGSCDSLTQYRCDDNSSTSYLMPYLEIHDQTYSGDTLWLQLWGNNGASGDIQLCVFEPARPDNHHCDSSQALTVSNSCNFTFYTTAYAGDSKVGTPTCGSYRTNDVWFHATVPSSGNLILTTSNNGIGNPAMAVYTGQCDSLINYTCNDNSGPSYQQPQIYIADSSMAGQNIKIRVWRVNSIYGGGFGICAFEPQVDSNNHPLGATFLEVEANCNYKRFDNINYTHSGLASPSCGAYVGADIWFKTIVPSSGKLLISTRSAGIGNAAMAIYTGQIDSLIQYTCNDNVGLYYQQPEILINDSSLAGDTIYMMLWKVNSIHSGPFDICVFEPSIPDNLDCMNATELKVKPSCNFERFTNEYGTTSGDGLPSCANYSGTDVWFKLLVPGSGKFTIDTRHVGASNFGMSIYSGTCGSLSEVACADVGSPYSSLMPSISVDDSSLANQTLYVQVWRKGSYNGTTFDICAYGDLRPEVLNPQGAIICQGEDIPTLRVHNGVFQYNWYSNKTGGTLLASDTFEYTPSTAGTYYVEAVNPINAQRSARTAVSLTINAQPTIIGAQDRSYCSLDEDKILAVQDEGDKYNWYADSSLGTLLATDTSKYEPLNTGDYYLKAETPNGCSSIHKLSFEIIQSPVVLNSLDQTACDNQIPVTLSVTDQGHDYDWYADSSLQNQLADNQASYGANSAGTYYIQATDPNSLCKSEIKSIELNLLPAPSISGTADISICEDALPVDIAVQDLGHEYSWFQDRTGTNPILSNSVKLSIQNEGTYYVRAKDISNACLSSMDSIVVDVQSSPLIVNPMSFTACSLDAYTGLSVQDRGDVYNWYSDENLTTAVAIDSVKIHPLVNGFYYVVAMDESSGCQSLAQQVELMIYPDYKPLIAYDNDFLHTQMANSYQWYKEGIAIFGATAQSYDVAASGNYRVEIIDSNQCLRVSETVNIASTLAIQEKLGQWGLYPNPSRDYTQLKFDPRWNRARADILDVHGAVVESYNLYGTEIKLNLSALSKGIYFVRLSKEKSVSYQRLLVQ